MSQSSLGALALAFANSPNFTTARAYARLACILHELREVSDGELKSILNATEPYLKGAT